MQVLFDGKLCPCLDFCFCLFSILLSPSPSLCILQVGNVLLVCLQMHWSLLLPVQIRCWPFEMKKWAFHFGSVPFQFQLFHVVVFTLKLYLWVVSSDESLLSYFPLAHQVGIHLTILVSTYKYDRKGWPNDSVGKGTFCQAFLCLDNFT